MPVTIQFTDAQINQLNQALQEINELLPIMDDMESCGINCQAKRQELERKRKMMENIRQKFAFKRNGQ